jgi:hypothetical protein
MRSATRRRGIEIFRTVPRIDPLKFPQRKASRNAGAGESAPARQFFI